MLINRLKMAQGGLSLCDKSLTQALNILETCDSIDDSHRAGDQDQEQFQTELEFYGELLNSGEF